MFDETFLKCFEKQLNIFHSLFKNNRPKGELLEELISNALSDAGVDHEWECYSHNSAYDIKIGDTEVSVKTGSVTKKGIMSISSFRTTKHKTINEKIIHVEKNKSDVMILCPFIDDAYHVYVIDTKVLSLTNRHWIEDAKGNFKSIDNVVDASFTKSMSGQLWYKVNLEKLSIKPIGKIEISK